MRSTSNTDARMVVVWSRTTVRPMAEAMEAFNCGMAARMLSTVSRMFAPGSRKITIRAQGFPFASPADCRFSTEFCTSATSDSFTAAPLL